MYFPAHHAIGSNKKQTLVLPPKSLQRYHLSLVQATRLLLSEVIRWKFNMVGLGHPIHYTCSNKTTWEDHDTACKFVQIYSVSGGLRGSCTPKTTQKKKMRASSKTVTGIYRRKICAKANRRETKTPKGQRLIGALCHTAELKSSLRGPHGPVAPARAGGCG